MFPCAYTNTNLTRFCINNPIQFYAHELLMMKMASFFDLKSNTKFNKILYLQIKWEYRIQGNSWYHHSNKVVIIETRFLQQHISSYIDRKTNDKTDFNIHTLKHFGKLKENSKKTKMELISFDVEKFLPISFWLIGLNIEYFNWILWNRKV